MELVAGGGITRILPWRRERDSGEIFVLEDALRRLTPVNAIAAVLRQSAFFSIEFFLGRLDR